MAPQPYGGGRARRPAAAGARRRSTCPLRGQQLGAALLLDDVAGGLLHALGVGVHLGAGTARAGAARPARTARGAAAGAEGPERSQPAERAGEIGERLGVGGSAYRLRLVEVRDLDVEVDLAALEAVGALLLGGGHLELQLDRQPADDLVVLAGVDVERRVLDRVLDRLLLLGGEGGGQATGLGDAELAGLRQQLADAVEELGDVDARGDVDRRRPLHVLRALVLRALEPVLRVDAQRRERRVRLRAVLLGLRALEALLEGVEELARHLVGVALQLDVALVPGLDGAGGEVLALRAELEVEVELRQLAG